MKVNKLCALYVNEETLDFFIATRREIVVDREAQKELDKRGYFKRGNFYWSKSMKTLRDLHKKLLSSLKYDAINRLHKIDYLEGEEVPVFEDREELHPGQFTFVFKSPVNA